MAQVRLSDAVQCILNDVLQLDAAAAAGRGFGGTAGTLRTKSLLRCACCAMSAAGPAVFEALQDRLSISAAALEARAAALAAEAAAASGQGPRQPAWDDKAER